MSFTAEKPPPLQPSTSLSLSPSFGGKADEAKISLNSMQTSDSILSDFPEGVKGSLTSNAQPFTPTRSAAKSKKQYNINNNSNNNASNLNNNEHFTSFNTKNLNSPTTSIYGLDMSAIGLRVLSTSLFTASFTQNITRLFLSHNLLTSIPPMICIMSNLAILDLSHNKLSKIPTEIGRMHSLKQLLLYDNLLNVLPSQICWLWTLEVLGLEGNPWIEPVYSLLKQGSLSMLQVLRENYSNDI